jgi:glycosyltransferase involved in cell wall biosynthesis
MKVLHISTFDTKGGAAKAAYRLHQGLLDIGVDSRMLVQTKFSNDQYVLAKETQQLKAKIRIRADSWPTNISKSASQLPKLPFSLGCLPDSIPSKVTEINPDVVNLHWITGGFLSIESIAKIDRPIVWTLHDMWAFTGGCHYAGDCELYRSNCANCPQMLPNYNIDLSKWVFDRKIKNWENTDITAVSPSNWLSRCASTSSLFKTNKVHVISNSLNLEIYRPLQRDLARKKFNLPENKYLILFGAENIDNPYKGFHLLKDALERLSLSNWQNKCELVIFGFTELKDTSIFGFKIHYLGSIDGDEEMASLYNIADVFVSPSMQDNLPNTILESLACGTPCVALDIGGMSDMVEHQINGYLAIQSDPDSLAQGIAWVLRSVDEEDHNLRQNARQTANERFSMNQQANSYLQLYENINLRSNTNKN